VSFASSFPELIITVNILPDILACAALLMLAIYHLMIYWGRKHHSEERYNLYFAAFVLSATLFIVAPYFQPQYFLYSYKPSWLYVINIEALMSCCLFIGGIAFLNPLLKLPERQKRYFYFCYCAIPTNFLLTLTANFISLQFYFSKVLPVVLLIYLANIILIYTVYGRWFFQQKLYKENFYRVLYFGFIALTVNIYVYRTIELLSIPDILVINHYVSVILLFLFTYALSVKFNKEFFELRDLKVSLEKKVADRTSALELSHRLLEQKNTEVENQKEEIVSTNDQLARRAAELTELNQARSRFFTGISHEFRTPLTLIIGPLEVLLSRMENEKNKVEYEMMLRQANRLLVLVNQFLELSKLQKGQQQLNLVEDNLSLFVQTVMDGYSSHAHELGITFLFIEETSDICVAFDHDKMEKILTNLLANAFKFTPSGGLIEVILDHGDDRVSLAVRDNGRGIDHEKLKYIFDPFYQADDPDNERMEGTGIGLSLVKELAELHSGEVNVISSPGKGSEFTVSFPCDLRTGNTISEKSASQNPGGFKAIVRKEPRQPQRAVILVVEDNQDMRTFIKTNLPADYMIEEAENGFEGFDKALKLIPDLIVADVMMPVLNGIDMIRNIKEDERVSHIPVIILTAKASAESKLEGLATHADDYITKPFNIHELTLRIDNLLINRAKMKERFARCITVEPAAFATSSVDEKFLQKALKIVEENMDETEFSAEKLSTEICVSRAHLHRKLKALTGQSATGFIRSIRLKRAIQLLQQNAGNVSEVAYQTGFNNLSYFTRCFKEEYGVLPSSYHSLIGKTDQ
jgi:signal transduction histidine kinase/DNA-binding response OmpR family regulator